jgi:glycosyltransferase involved in cell wall biosynthesis
MKKNNFPRISIVTPTYNQANFISQTVQSVLGQKYPNLSYVVMDGKSSDNTAEVIKPFQSQLQFYSEKDKGQADAINKGIQLVLKNDPQQSDIFAYINSDDYYLPQVFERVALEFAKYPDKMWLVGDAIIVGENNQSIQGPIRWYKRLWRSFLSNFILTVLNPIPQPAVFIRAAVVKKLGLFKTDLHYTMDYEYWLRLYQNLGRPILLNEPLAAFRIHSVSKGSTGFEAQFQEGYEVASQYTSNSLALLLHRLHNQVIFLVYRLIK